MSNFKVSIVVPGKPVPKARFRMTKSGHTYTDKATLQQEKAVKILGKAAMKAAMKGGSPITADGVEMDIAFVFEMPKSWSLKKRAEKLGTPHGVRPDLDNLVKMICDVMNKGFYVDDSQICMLQAEKIYGTPRTEVVIEEL